MESPGPVSRDSFCANEVCLPLFFCSASAASVERKGRKKKKKKIERFFNVHLVSKRQLFYCSGLYAGLGFNVGCFSVLHPGRLWWAPATKWVCSSSYVLFIQRKRLSYAANWPLLYKWIKKEKTPCKQREEKKRKKVQTKDYTRKHKIHNGEP